MPAGDPDKTAVGEISTATKETRFIINDELSSYYEGIVCQSHEKFCAVWSCIKT